MYAIRSYYVDRLYSQFKDHNQYQGQSRFLLGMGASLLLASALLLNTTFQPWAFWGIVGASGCWLLGWWKTKPRR